MRRVIAAAVVALALGACNSGGSSTTSTTAPTTTTSTIPLATGQDYLDIVAPANAATDVVNAKLDALPSSATAKQVADIVEPLIPIFTDIDNKLLRANWPAKAVEDVKSLVRASGQVTALFGKVRTQSAFSIGSFNTEVTKAYGAFGSAAQIVRADLGLPPPKSP